MVLERWSWMNKRGERRYVSVKDSPADTAGETAPRVVPFRCLHLGLSGWRS